MGHYASEMGPTPWQEEERKRQKIFDKALKRAIEHAPNKFVKAKLEEAKIYDSYQFNR